MAKNNREIELKPTSGQTEQVSDAVIDKICQIIHFYWSKRNSDDPAQKVKARSMIAAHIGLLRQSSNHESA